MSYTKMWNNTDILFRQSQNSRFIFQSFISLVQKRVEIEQNYAKELQVLSESCQRFIKKESSQSILIFVLSAFKSNITRRAAQTIQFSKQIKQDILQIIKQFFKKQSDEVSIIQNQIMSLQQSFESHYSKMKKWKNKMNDANESREQSFINLQIFKNRLFYNKNQEDKMVNKVKKQQKQYLTNQSTAKDVLKEYNGFVNKYYTQLDKKLLRLENHEVDRFNEMNNNMKKILVFEVSMMKNFEYDVINLSNQLDSASDSKNKDVEQLVRRYTKEQPRKGLETIPKSPFMDSVLLGLIQKDLEKKMKVDRSIEIRAIISKLIKEQALDEDSSKILPQQKIKYIKDILALIKAESLDANILKQKLNEQLDDFQNRNYAQLALRIEIESNQYQTTQNHFVLIQYLLEKCFKKKDIFCIRSILKIIFTQLTMKSAKNKYDILYGQFINSFIWKDHKFWSALLFESVQEHLKIFKGKNKNNQTFQEASIQQQNIILSQILHSCHIMLMCGYSNSKVKKISDRGELKGENIETNQLEFSSAFTDLESRQAPTGPRN